MALDNDFKALVDNTLSTNMEFAQTVWAYLNNMNRGFYPKSDMHFVTQKHYQPRYDVYDAYFFAQIHTMIARGMLIGCRIHMGTEPKSDSSGQWFNDILNQLSDPFHAEFQGGAGSKDNDGFLEWKSEIILDNPKVNRAVCDPVHKTVGAMRIPLEVGTTSAWNTYFHILSEGGVARWPYGSNEIIVWVKDFSNEQNNTKSGIFNYAPNL